MGKRYGQQTGQGRQTSSLSDRDILNDMLLTEKYLAEMLNNAVLESSVGPTRQMFKSMQDNTQEHAQMIFEEMSSKGWYNTPGAGAGQGMQQQWQQRYRTGDTRQMQGFSRPRSGSYRGYDTREYQHGSLQTF
jgi:spore coat protein CotF